MTTHGITNSSSIIIRRYLTCPALVSQLRSHRQLYLYIQAYIVFSHLAASSSLWLLYCHTLRQMRSNLLSYTSLLLYQQHITRNVIESMQSKKILQLRTQPFLRSSSFLLRLNLSIGGSLIILARPIPRASHPFFAHHVGSARDSPKLHVHTANLRMHTTIFIYIYDLDRVKTSHVMDPLLTRPTNALHSLSQPSIQTNTPLAISRTFNAPSCSSGIVN
jgi:hypothetical protein